MTISIRGDWRREGRGNSLVSNNERREQLNAHAGDMVHTEDKTDRSHGWTPFWRISVRKVVVVVEG